MAPTGSRTDWRKEGSDRLFARPMACVDFTPYINPSPDFNAFQGTSIIPPRRPGPPAHNISAAGCTSESFRGITWWHTDDTSINLGVFMTSRIAGVWMAFVLAAAALATAQTYTITDIGVLKGDNERSEE